MDVVDMLRRSGGVDAVAKQLEIAPGEAAAGAQALVPAIVGGFARQSAAAGGGEAGLGSLVAMLGGLGGGDLAANVLGPDPTEIGRGNQVLGEIFGSKDVSRTVAVEAAAQSGVGADTLKRMLPLLAMLIGGYLSARAQGGGKGGQGWIGALLDPASNPLDAMLGAPDDPRG